jgi:hypothetical protein
MRVWVAGLLTAAVIAVLIGAIPSAAIAKTCSSSYVHGVIGGVQKCLERGEFCAHRYASQYRRYHFKCVSVNGHYRLEPSS